MEIEGTKDGQEENNSLAEKAGRLIFALIFSFYGKVLWSSDRFSTDMAVFKGPCHVFVIFLKKCDLPETTLSKYFISWMPS